MSSNSNPFPNRAPCSRLLRTMSRTILNISTIFLGNLCWCPASYTINKCLLLFRGKLLSSIFSMLLLVLVLGTTEKNLTPLSAPLPFFPNIHAHRWDRQDFPWASCSPWWTSSIVSAFPQRDATSSSLWTLSRMSTFSMSCTGESRTG